MFDKEIIEYLIRRVKSKREDDKKTDMAKVVGGIVSEYLISTKKNLIRRYNRLYKSVLEEIGCSEAEAKTRSDK